MRNGKTSHVSDGSATKSGAFSRREWMRALGASALGGGLLGATSRTLRAQHLQAPAGPPIIDAHIHMWQLPRSLPPMSDGATYPGDPTDGFCCTINANNPSG